ncbi:Nif3-like dinuclear metal center hexameric protein [Candidatus Caldatribacterium saccharofermentans]|uniref:Nif3-like dinuclear metal center hexameric protein n=1 Tax=Candidatus Caldatribacterium saccharofermentans TaxID=1454753 RepID=UPI003D004303
MSSVPRGNATDWLKNTPVYLEKKKLIESHGIAIWRYHDSMPMVQPDGIYTGLWKEIDWERYLVSKDNPWIYEIPETTLADLARFFKEKLSVGVVRIVGNPDMKVSRVGILVGGGSLGLGREEI